MKQAAARGYADSWASDALIICNVSEFNRRFVQQAPDAGEWVHLYSQLPFSLVGLRYKNSWILTHEQPSPEVLAHWRERLNFAPLFLCCPPRTGNLCLDTLANSGVQARLAELCAGEIQIRPWGQTHPLEELLSRTGDVGCSWQRNSATLVSLLDAKVGNRALIEAVLPKQNGLFSRLPTMFAPAESRGLSDAVDAMLAVWPEVIVKPAATWGGKGTFSVSRTQEVRDVDSSAPQDDLGSGIYAVEPLVGNVADNLSPSIDWMPNGDGTGRCFVGRMLMDGFKCAGTVYGRNASSLSNERRSKVQRFVSDASAMLHAIGYSGWFDVDFLVAKRRIYVNELNIRHTGGTVPIEIACALLGPHWEREATCVAIDGIPTSRNARQILKQAQRLGLNEGRPLDAFVLTAFRTWRDQSKASIWLSSDDPDRAMSNARQLQEWLLS